MQMVTRSCFGVPNIREFLWSPVGALRSPTRTIEIWYDRFLPFFFG